MFDLVFTCCDSYVCKVFFFFFFFSSRRRHTRWPRDWSSDVCSSDLLTRMARLAREAQLATRAFEQARTPVVRSEERRVGKSVDLGGRRIIKKKKKKEKCRCCNNKCTKQEMSSSRMRYRI